MKITKGDLTTTGGIGFVLRAYVFLYLFFAALLFLAVVSELVLASLSVSVAAWFPEWTILLIALSAMISCIASLKRASILVGRDFWTLHWIRTIGGYLQLIFIAPFYLVSVVLLLAAFGVVKVEMLSLVVAWIVVFEGMAVGVILDIYVRVFTPRTLAKLYFEQASESKDQNKEIRAIREGFKQLREDATVFNLELSTSRFEQLLDTRLYKGSDVKGELAALMRHLSDGDSVVVALKELVDAAEDFLSPAKAERKWQSYLELTLKYVVPSLISLVALLVQKFP